MKSMRSYIHSPLAGTLGSVSLALLAFLGTLSYTACSSSEPGEAKSSSAIPTVTREAGSLADQEVEPEQVARLQLKTGSLQKIVAPKYIDCTGYVDVPPQNLATISAPMGGFVSQISPYPGTYLKQGAVIARLKHPDYVRLQQQYLEARSQLTYLQKEYERQKQLSEAQAGTRKILEKTLSELQVLQAQQASLASQLRFIGLDPEAVQPEHLQEEIVIRAPFSGYVLEVMTNYGKYIGQHEVLVEMLDNRHIHLELAVFEKDMYALKKGQRIRFSVAKTGMGGAQYPAEVFLIGQSVNNETRTLNVHGHIQEEYEQLFKPGTYVQATIEAQSDSSWCLPVEAVVKVEGESRVFVQQPSGHYALKAVTTGDQYDGMVEILPTEALLDAQVVLEGARALLAGMEEG